MNLHKNKLKTHNVQQTLAIQNGKYWFENMDIQNRKLM